MPKMSNIDAVYSTSFQKKLLYGILLYVVFVVVIMILRNILLRQQKFRRCIERCKNCSNRRSDRSNCCCDEETACHLIPYYQCRCYIPSLRFLTCCCCELTVAKECHAEEIIGLNAAYSTHIDIAPEGNNIFAIKDKR